MRARHALIALATTVLLTAALPALGSLLPVYHFGGGAQAEAYATVDGACGTVDPWVPDGQRRHLTFCFGPTPEASAHNQGGSVALSTMWVRDTQCHVEESQEVCEGFTQYFFQDQVAITVDPLLETATAINPDGCGGIDLTLTAYREASLTTSTGSLDHDAGVGPNGGGAGVNLGPSSGSVGRDATVTGTLCGVDLTQADAGGRILRGVGTTGIGAGGGAG
ncbi:MAG TPA: hypothetical protein VI916_02190 [Acidimicrobiia bacterium]|nr:hypothetical protein [Acidimicrobiia bacterium]